MSESSQYCIKLYPTGTLGRVFIDIAIDFIVHGIGGCEKRGDKLCITSRLAFKDSLVALLEVFGKGVPRIAYPLTGRDKGSLNKLSAGHFEAANPLSLVNYVVKIVDEGGLSLLDNIGAAPSIMRIEFYEYARPGIIVKFTSKQKEHMYKRANLLSIALSILGSYITFVAAEDNTNKYYVPAIISSINEFIEVKNMLKKIHDKKRPIQSYMVARKILEIKTLSGSDVLGDMIYVARGKNRHTLTRWEKISSEGMYRLLAYLDKNVLNIFDKIVYSMLDNEDVEKTFYTVVDSFYKYSIGVGDALYDTVREIQRIIENMRDSISKNKKDSIWYKAYIQLTKHGIKDPINSLEYLSKTLPLLVEVEFYETT